MPGGSARLLERDAELERLLAAVTAARAGRGELVVVEGPAGQGKTALLRALRAEAGAAGARVLWATGAPMERDFPFGVVRQLLEAPLRAADAAARERLLAGAAGHAGAMVLGEPARDGAADAGHALLHGLYWLTANLAELSPLLLVVDDAHWADGPSLRFLDVLARRLEDLPVALVVAARPSEPGDGAAVLDELALHAADALLQPGALSAAAVGTLVEAALGHAAEPAFVGACHATTGGSPLLVTELVRTLPRAGFSGVATEADAVRAAVPETVGRGVAARLREVSPQALGVARAVAVLGDGARLAQVATLAGVTPEAAAAEHAGLARAALLEAGRVAFVHPMVREALLAALPAGERDALHRAAATVLTQAGAPEEEVAAHLLLADPAGDDAARAVLERAGRRALAGGAPDIARRLLARAMAEAVPGADGHALLLALGQAEAALGDPAALAHLQAAARDAPVPVAARADLARATVLILANRADEAAAILQAALERGAPEPLRDELEEVLLSALDYVAGLVETKRELLARANGSQPVVLAHQAFDAALTGESQAVVRALATAALEDRALLEPVGEERLAGMYAVEALMIAELAPEAAAGLRVAEAAARRTGSRLAAGVLALAWTRWEMLYGDLRRAEAQARLGIELWGEGLGEDQLSPAAWIALGTACLERGDLDGAAAAAERLPHSERGTLGFHGIPVLRARLALAGRRPQDALALLEAQFDVERRRGWVISPRHNARSVQVAALADAGRPEEALAVAREHAALAAERGSLSMQAPILVAAARALPAPEAVPELEVAVVIARRGPMRRVLAQALGALGAAQRRSGRRAAARETLREARDLAHQIGAGGLEAQVLDELVVAGGRPQRIALDGLEALTPAERRVAELAAGGLRNREIAETLFVTLKTVEVHLGRAYGKLGIQGRSQLHAALGGR